MDQTPPPPTDLEKTTPSDVTTTTAREDNPLVRVASEMENHWLPEFLLRLGLLLGAGLFLYEGVGSPLDRNLFALAGVALSALVVTTMVFQWKVLGDWRLPHNQVLYGVCAVVLTLPITAAIAPAFGTSLLPNVVETPLVDLSARLRQVPGLGALAAFMRGIIAFTFVVLLLVILMITSGPGRRGGLIFVGLVLTMICLFFHPTAETIAGLLLLGAFFRYQWEIPLILPPKVRQFLRPEQVDFLYELQARGPLTTGETRILLNNDPNQYAELTELKLVEFDQAAREVYPGNRLLSDSASSAVASAFEYARRTAWLLVGLTYVILPDFIPGPVDDIIVLALCIASGFSLFSLGSPRRRRLT